MHSNIRWVARDYDVLLFITQDFEVFKNNFRHMPADELDNVSSIWFIMYDDRRDVGVEMGGDLMIMNKDTEEILEENAFEKRIPGIVIAPLSLKEFLSLNKNYKQN